MKNILIAILFLLLTLTAKADVAYTPVDVLTLTTNSVTNTAQITITNVCTNAWYTVKNTNNPIYGDHINVAFGKINTFMTLLASALRTNGASANGQIPYKTNTAAGFFWADPPSGGGGSSNAIPTLNGSGTNTTLVTASSVAATNLVSYGTTWLNNSNLIILYYADLPSLFANSNWIAGATSLASTNIYGGIATASDAHFGYSSQLGIQDGNASGFTTWTPSDQQNGTLQYKNPPGLTNFNAIVINLIGAVNGGTGTGTNKFQISNDGSSWSDLFSMAFNVGPGGTIFQTNYFARTSANYIRDVLTTSAGHTTVGFVPLMTPINVITSSPPMEIDSPNGVAINTNTTGGYTLNVNSNINVTGFGAAYYVNGVPLGQAATTTYSQLYVTGGYGSATNLNGVFTLGAYGLYTNLLGSVLIPIGYSTNVSGTNLTAAAYILGTNIIGNGSPPRYNSATLLGAYNSVNGSPTNTLPVVSYYNSSQTITALGSPVASPFTALGGANPYTTPAQRGMLYVSLICGSATSGCLSNQNSHFTIPYGTATSIDSSIQSIQVMTSPGDAWAVMTNQATGVQLNTNWWQGF